MKTRTHDRAADKTAFSIAMPLTLKADLERIAAIEHRNRNGQIVHFLAESVSRYDAEKKSTAPLYPMPSNLSRDIAAEPQAAYGLKADAAAEVLRARAAGKAQPPTAQERP